LLPREKFRKIASLGHQLLAPKVRRRRHGHDSNESDAKRSFLTLLWTQILEHNNLLEPSSASALHAVRQFASLLNRIPHPTNGGHWQMFSDTFDPEPAEEFRKALKTSDFNELWTFPETASWSYQYYLEPGLEIFRSPSAPKIHARHLATRTQQFTPRWIADFLVQNTLGRLWLQMHPDSELRARLPYLVVPPAPLPPIQPKPASEITILDPACGTMHLGLPVLDLLRFMYREELARAGQTGWPANPSVPDESEISNAIVRNNLFGMDIDPLAIELATLTLFLSLDGAITQAPHMRCLDTLKRPDMRIAHAGFPSQFDVLLLNPPYLDKRDYNLRLKAFMAKHYKASGRNLYTAFLDRSLELLRPGGRLGAVTPQTFMFIRSFAGLRNLLLNQTAIETLVHTGLNTFDDAVVDCAFYVLRREPDEQTRVSGEGRYLQLTAPTSSEEKHSQMTRMLDQLRRDPNGNIPCCYNYRQADFSALPDQPWVYWISPRIRRLFGELPSLGSVAELRQGLATTDNERFLRYWWEIPRDRVAWNCENLTDAENSGKKWFPYMKGGGYVKWYGCREFLVNWGQNGREIKEEICRRYPYINGSWQWVAKNSEFYFREGITYSYLTSGKFSARYMPTGSVFDVAGSSVFCKDLWLILAILNSRWCRFALGLINPTVNFQVGDLQRLPVPTVKCPATLKRLVLEAIDLAKSLDAIDETSPDFVSPPPWPEGCSMVTRTTTRLTAIQHEVDHWIYQLYGLGKEDQELVERQTPPDEISFTMDHENLAYRWISYAVGVAMGRYVQSFTVLPDLLHLLLPNDHQGLASQVRTALEKMVGRSNSNEIIQAVSPSGHLHEFLIESFFDRHFRHFHHRPIYWLLSRNGQLLALNCHAFDSGKLSDLCEQWIPKPTKTKTAFDPDNGILTNLRPFSNLLAVNSWKRAMR